MPERMTVDRMAYEIQPTEETPLHHTDYRGLTIANTMTFNFSSARSTSPGLEDFGHDRLPTEPNQVAGGHRLMLSPDLRARRLGAMMSRGLPNQTSADPDRVAVGERGRTVHGPRRSDPYRNPLAATEQ